MTRGVAISLVTDVAALAGDVAARAIAAPAQAAMRSDIPQIAEASSRRSATATPVPRRDHARRAAVSPRALTVAELQHQPEAAPVVADWREPPYLPPPLVPVPLAQGPDRLAGSAWLIARGAAPTVGSTGRLGGSQLGARLTYALGDSRRVALAARMSAPLRGRGREAAMGVDWQPLAIPFHILAEQRVSLDGGKGGPTLMAIGGIGPVDVARGMRVEAYAQAGAIVRDGVERFADGAVRVTHPLRASRSGIALDLGIGAWGAAQRGAARLDVGPTLGIALPVGERRLRLTADWRQRVAGRADPGSGPAIGVGSDF